MSEFGPVPIELDEVYPIAQSLFPQTRDRDTIEHIRDSMEDLAHRQSYGMSCMYDEESTVEMLSALSKPGSGFHLDQARIRAVADYQFGNGAGKGLFDGKVELVKSRNTDKIRNVIVDGEHVVSMRADDGFFTLRPPGARRLMAALPAPKMRVVVEDDSVPFNREGKNVMCQFVIECDPELGPMDEVLIVDNNDSLVAIGRALMVRDEMLCFKKGLAVRVREGLKEVT
jgi:7-cyano-7-deazaguanine tRNA-ribosyltransferase